MLWVPGCGHAHSLKKAPVVLDQTLVDLILFTFCSGNLSLVYVTSSIIVLF